MSETLKKDTVWAVIHTWATEDETDCSVHVFDSYPKALSEMNAIVSDERDSDWYACLQDKVEDEREGYWEVSEEGRYTTNHSCVKIETLEVY